VANQFSGSTVIDRPIDQVFAFLADGTNDPKFSPRVQEIRKTSDGPVGVGTTFESTVKDAGMTTSRKFELTEVQAPTKIRWAERSKNLVTATDGGYDLEAVSDAQTKVTVHNILEGHGFGKLVVGFAARAAAKDAPAFAERIKAAVEAGAGEAAAPAPDAAPEAAPPADPGGA
jgi:carbon monoxide dehydrogenase subunit G